MRPEIRIVNKVLDANPSKSPKEQRRLALKAFGSPKHWRQIPCLREAITEIDRRAWFAERRLHPRKTGRGPGIIYSRILPRPGTKEHGASKRAGLPGRMISLHATKGWRTARIELV